MGKVVQPVLQNTAVVEKPYMYDSQLLSLYILTIQNKKKKKKKKTPFRQSNTVNGNRTIK